MSEIILHEYPQSPFSEKIRSILRYKGLDYQSVTIPVIMPKPDLMPLTGGYRKTPVMQIGADIYCDSSIIARVIDDLHPEPGIFPAALAATAGTMAHWTDTFFFKVAVAVAFQPRALADNPVLSDGDQAAAFAADRAELTKGSTELQMPLETAHPYFLQHLARLEKQLERASRSSASPFLFGEEPVIADFSTYHCLWFIWGNEAIRDTFDPFHQVRAWLERMKDMGDDTTGRPLDGAAALDIARQREPAAAGPIESSLLHGIDPGKDVEIMPIDYGFQPVRGRLVTATLEEIALIRTDDSVGEVAVHFPRLGFQVKQAS